MKTIHYEEIELIMKETGCSFRKWDGEKFWTLAKECGHTSLDFKKCECSKTL